MKLRRLAPLAALVLAQPALAADLDITGLAQGEFEKVSKNLAAALSYKAVTPAEPLGLPGFDLGLEVSSTEIDDSTLFDNAFSGDAPSSIIVPKLHAHIGLPFNLDIGAFITSVPSTNIKLVGGELRYSILEGGVAMPALAVRGTFSSLNGVDTLDFSTKGLELTISKGFAMVTPYAGVGTVRTTSDPNVTSGPSLSKESFSQTKLYAGLNFNMGLMNIALEGDKTGDFASYSAKLGFRF
ncbi:MAG: hypothetical protein AB1810_04360 [Pseudomonadota bacterium]